MMPVMSPQHRRIGVRLLTAAAYVALLIVGGIVVYRLLVPPERPKPEVSTIHYHASERLTDLQVGNFEIPQNTPEPYDPWNNRPFVGRPQMPRKASSEPSMQPRTPCRAGCRDRNVRPNRPARTNTRITTFRRKQQRGQTGCCRPCASATIQASGVVAGSPPPDPIPESVGTKRTTLPISNQP